MNLLYSYEHKKCLDIITDNNLIIQQKHLNNINVELLSKCNLCNEIISHSSFQCTTCQSEYHLNCAATQELTNRLDLIPLYFTCQECNVTSSWVDIIRNIDNTNIIKNKEKELIDVIDSSSDIEDNGYCSDENEI